MMVGSHPQKFKVLAERAEMPEDRQASGKGDFTFAEWSWETLLKPHLRPARSSERAVRASV